MRLTDALVSQLEFHKGKDAEVAWIDGEILIRENQLDAKRLTIDNEPMDGSILTHYIFHNVTLVYNSSKWRRIEGSDIRTAATNCQFPTWDCFDKWVKTIRI